MIKLCVISFIIGCAVVLVRHKIKTRREQERIGREMVFERALMEMSTDEVQELYETVDPVTAREIIVNNYMTKYGLGTGQ